MRSTSSGDHGKEEESCGLGKKKRREKKKKKKREKGARKREKGGGEKKKGGGRASPRFDKNGGGWLQGARG